MPDKGLVIGSSETYIRDITEFCFSLSERLWWLRAPRKIFDTDSCLSILRNNHLLQMKVIVVSCFFVSLITLHQRNLSIKQENVLISFSFIYQLNTLPETMQQILPHREELWVTSAIQGDRYDHKKLEEENRVRSTSTLPHGKVHHR